MPPIILLLLIIVYLSFTIRDLLFLKKINIFTKKVKLFHTIMVCIIPFIWIMLIKSLIKSTPGSYEIENKAEPTPFSNSSYKFPPSTK